MFRLKQKHAPKPAKRLPPADGRTLLAEQSMARGTLGSIGTALLLCWGWALFSMSAGQIFPWATILMGAMIGLAMQRFGRGLDWKYPVTAVVITGIAAYVGNLAIGILQTGHYIDAEPIRVLGGLSMDTMRNFFRNTINPIDHIYAFSACGVAAFFANRRLKRHEVLGLRTMHRENQ
jgi:hypothetical protein